VSHFEFITVAISIVLALGVSRLLDVLPLALRSPQRSWIHAGWVVQKFFNHVIWWWGIWLLHQTVWNLALFVLQLVGPVILYLQASALARPSDRLPTSWEARFFEIRVPFFLGNIALVLLTLANSSIFATSQAVPLVPLLTLGALGVAGLATRSIQVHAAIVGLALLVQLVGLGSAAYRLAEGT
jgi:hypothetical protein